MSLKIILVDDHILVRQGIGSLLRNETDIVIAGEARNGIEALDLCERLRPDVVLMDIHMPVMNGMECTRVLRENFPDLKIIVVSMHNSAAYLVEMMLAGANGYVLKNSSRDELLLAINKVVSGGKYISPELTLTVIEEFKNSQQLHPKQHLTEPLSDGEKEILELMAEGLTNTQMAEKLFLSIRTVESRRKRLLDKTGTTNTATLMKFAVTNGLVS